MKTCCQDQKNLVIRPSDYKDAILRICSVCCCRHIEFDAEPIRVGVMLATGAKHCA